MNGAIMKHLVQHIVKTVVLSALVVAATVCSTTAQEASRLRLSSLDSLAARASQTVDVNIDERLMRMAAKVLSNEGDEQEVKKLISGIKGIYVKSFEFEHENEYSAADVEDIRSQLRLPSWSKLVNVTSKKEGNVEVYVLFNGDTVGGLAILSTEPKELTVVNIVGPVDLEKLAKFEGQFGIPDLGLEPTKSKTKKEEN
jgi:hypothetical protein